MHTRECTGRLVERCITAERLSDHLDDLDDLVAVRGAPVVSRSGISQAMADRAGTRTGLFYIPPGSPWLSGYVESFNSRIRNEYLNVNSFYPLLHARVVINDWTNEYYAVQGH